MQIRLVSSLTPEDEERLAPELLFALRAVLDSLPVSYTIRIEGVGKEFVRHTQMSAPGPRAPAHPTAVGLRPYR